MAKFRSGFVSNSSSASFVIVRKKIDSYQAEKVINYKKYMENYNPDWDYWSICEDEDEISGNTSMDNIDMLEYLESIGVSKKISHFTWD